MVIIIMGMQRISTEVVAHLPGADLTLPLPPPSTGSTVISQPLHRLGYKAVVVLDGLSWVSNSEAITMQAGAVSTIRTTTVKTTLQI